MGAIFSAITGSSPATMIGLALGALLALGGAAGGGAYIGYKVELSNYTALELKVANAEIDAANVAKAQQSAADAITLKSAVAEATAQQKIVTNTVTITKEIPIHVSDSSDCITYGLVRVLDAGALGIDPDAISLAPGVADDTCAPIKATALAAGIVGGVDAPGRAAIQEVTTWRGWYADQAKVWNAKGKAQ